MADLDELRRVAMALPDVTEQTHFDMPAFYVGGRGFASVRRDGTRLLLHATAGRVATALAEDDGVYRELRRGEALVGLDADLAALPADRLADLVDHAWHLRSPKKARTGR